MASIQTADGSISLSTSLGLPTPQEVLNQAAETYPMYLSRPPVNYQYQAPAPDDLASRKDAWRQRKIAEGTLPVPAQVTTKSISARPDTQEYYDYKGAISQPADGDNAKHELHSCLTCIGQGSRCHGTVIAGGRCLTCRGYNKDGEDNRETRNCRWREPQNQIFTYKQHTAKYSNASIESKKKKDRVKVKADGVPEEKYFRTIYDMEDRYAQRLLQAMTATIFDAGWVTGDAKKNLITMLVLACAQNARGIPGSVDGDNFSAVAEDIQAILFGMVLTGFHLSEDAINNLLPNDHPAKGV